MLGLVPPVFKVALRVLPSPKDEISPWTKHLN